MTVKKSRKKCSEGPCSVHNVRSISVWIVALRKPLCVLIVLVRLSIHKSEVHSELVAVRCLYHVLCRNQYIPHICVQLGRLYIILICQITPISCEDASVLGAGLLLHNFFPQRLQRMFCSSLGRGDSTGGVSSIKNIIISPQNFPHRKSRAKSILSQRQRSARSLAQLAVANGHVVNRRSRMERGTRQCHQKCRLAKAWPQPDFKYFSNASALRSSRKRTATTIFQGLHLAVWGDLPALCSLRRLFKSRVIPT